MDIYDVMGLIDSDDVNQRIVSAILENLQDRRGFKHLFSDIDDDIINEMNSELIAIVAKETAALGGDDV